MEILTTIDNQPKASLYFILSSLLFLVSVSQACQAQSTNDCTNFMKYGIYDEYNSLSYAGLVNRIRHLLQTSTATNFHDLQSQGLSIGITVEELPIRFGGYNRDDSSSFYNWKKSLATASDQQ
jgi:hypothetical protein